jgi:hypothetical protein
MMNLHLLRKIDKSERISIERNDTRDFLGRSRYAKDTLQNRKHEVSHINSKKTPSSSAYLHFERSHRFEIKDRLRDNDWNGNVSDGKHIFQRHPKDTHDFHFDFSLCFPLERAADAVLCQYGADKETIRHPLANLMDIQSFCSISLEKKRKISEMSNETTQEKGDQSDTSQKPIITHTAAGKGSRNPPDSDKMVNCLISPRTNGAISGICEARDSRFDKCF